LKRATNLAARVALLDQAKNMLRQQQAPLHPLPVAHMKSLLQSSMPKYSMLKIVGMLV
jgi:hypothetical protein